MRCNRHLLIGLILLVFAGCKKEEVITPVIPDPQPQGPTFKNPVLPRGSDPWVIQKDNYYYYTQTSGDRINLWRTTAMSKLDFSVPQTIWSKPATGPNSERVWAPELHFLDGKWYMYYTAGSSGDINLVQRVFVLENSSIDATQGTWVDKGKVADPAADFWAIDATVFEHNGSSYLVWSGHSSNSETDQRLYIARMKNPWTLETARTEISAPTLTWEIVGNGVNEGPEILISPAGKVFLVFSASGCWTDEYTIGMLQLKDGGDPLKAPDWIKLANPFLVKKPENQAYAPGHCSFFKSPDGKEDWIVYHANSAPNQGCDVFRNPRIQKFTWNADGTPHFGEPVKINTPITKPSGEQ